MQNIGQEQFTYETFKSAYETDPRLKSLISDYNKDEIKIKTDEPDLDTPETPDAPDAGDGVNSVSQLAAQATDLNDM